MQLILLTLLNCNIHLHNSIAIYLSAYSNRGTGYHLRKMVIGVRDGGGGLRGRQLTTQNSGTYDIYSGKRQHICLSNCVTERNKYASTLRYISGEVTKETFIGYYSTTVKNRHCNSSLFFLPDGAA